MVGVCVVWVCLCVVMSFLICVWLVGVVGVKIMRFRFGWLVIENVECLSVIWLVCGWWIFFVVFLCVWILWLCYIVLNLVLVVCILLMNVCMVCVVLLCVMFV